LNKNIFFEKTKCFFDNKLTSKNSWTKDTKENKRYFTPLKITKNINSITEDLYSVIEKYKRELSLKEYEIINKKIKYLNTPFNANKPIKAFEFYNIKLSESYIKLIKNRNLFLHGSTPYKENLYVDNLSELHLDSIRLHVLASILVLKYCDYSGHLINLTKSHIVGVNLDETGNSKLNEPLFFEI